MKRKDNLISIQKCKRIIRPLLSRIHSINELKSKDPSTTIINIPQFFNEEKDIPQDLRDPQDSWEPKRKKSKSKEHSLTSDLIIGFVKPASSQSRLLSLKPYVSYELFRAYIDIFQIFRNIFTALRTSTRVPSLSTLCCYKIGKEITLSTKSTYYRLNQVLLFDQKGVSKELQSCQKDLNDEIDAWLESEPAILMENYRTELVLGYVVHLIVFNSHLLYLLIPVLLQWLEEVGTEASRSVMRTLFHEFWSQGHAYTDIDLSTMMVLNGETSEHTDVFWLLDHIGYWRHLVLSLGLRSPVNCHDQYIPLMLDTLPFNNKLVNYDCLERVYELIKQCPQHPKVNTILILAITHIISKYRALLKSSTTTIAIYTHLKEAISSFMLLLNQWLAFVDHLVFNSLYPGNSTIFLAVSSFISFIIKKVIQVVEYLKKSIPHLHNQEKEKYTGLLGRLSSMGARTKVYLVALEVLRIYYLDTNEPIDIYPYTAKQVGNAIIDIIEPMSRSANSQFNHFLLYLNERLDLAQVCFKIYYGNSRNGLEEIRYILAID